MIKKSKIKTVPIIFLLFCFAQIANAGTYNIKEYGAKGDGKAIDSEAINKAITTASEAGGGTVYFPSGRYLSYSIRLKSNINLHFEQGCFLIGADATQRGRYDEPGEGAGNKFQDFGHSFKSWFLPNAKLGKARHPGWSVYVGWWCKQSHCT